MDGDLSALELIARRPMAEARLQQMLWRDVRAMAEGRPRTVGERVAFGLAAYDAWRLTADEALHCIRTMVEAEVEARTDPLYERDFAGRFDAPRQQHGLDPDDDWPFGQEPDDVRALDAEFSAASHRAECEVLREYAALTGHPLLHEMADLQERNPEAFWQRSEAGGTALRSGRKE